MSAHLERTVVPVTLTGVVEGVERPDGPGEAHHPSSRLSVLARLLLLVIGAWHWTAPMRVPRCRFEPSCSIYAKESIIRYGAARGGWHAVRRLSRCHPWNSGGVDPVD